MRCDIIAHMNDHSWKKTLQALFAFLIIPTLNAIAFCKTGALQTNLSDLSRESPLFLLLWGGCSALNFLLMSRLCYRRCGYTKKKARSFWLYASCLCMVLCVILPYDPVHAPALSQWHVRLGFIGTLCYLLQFLHFLLISIDEGWLFLRPFLYAYVLICFCSIYTTALSGGVTGMSEVTFSFAMSIYLYVLARACERQTP